jgi:hypothetical protein
MLQRAYTQDVVVADNATLAGTLALRRRGWLHRVNIVRISEDGSEETTADVEFRLYESADYATPANEAHGLAVQYLVMPALKSSDYASLSGRILYISETGMPYCNRDSELDATQHLYPFTLKAAGTGGGTYRITILSSSDDMS